MNVSTVTVDRSRARELFRAYKKHQHYSEPIDHEIQRTYQLIAQGRTVIQAFESIRLAGVNNGLPRLAICRADAKVCCFQPGSGRAVEFNADSHWLRQNSAPGKGLRFDWSIAGLSFRRGEARLPLIPIHLRPRRAMASYHVLWEAEWTPVPPVDPYLLRRIGGDLWLVVAAWELTAVERAALSTRMSG